MINKLECTKTQKKQKKYDVSYKIDVWGKRILSGKYKYYLTDLGLGRIVNTQNGIIHKNIIDWLLEEKY